MDASADFASVSFSGGSWVSTLPIEYLRDPLLSKVARSTNANLTSTKFDVDLGVPREARMLCIPKHNISRAGRIRVRAATDSGFTNVILDSGWEDVWKVVKPFRATYFEDPSFWDGKLSSEEADGYPMPYIYLSTSIVVARYWRIEVDDTTNEAGYVELSRLVITAGWQPPRNLNYGNQLSWEDLTESQQSRGGARFYDTRPKRRVIRFTINYINLDESLGWPFEMMRLQGVSRQVMFIFDPDDTIHLHRRSFLATMRQLSPIEYPFHELNSVAFELEEVIA